MTDYAKPQNLLTPIKAIRAKCLDCAGGQANEVRLWPVYTCALHPYRMGRRPTHKDWDHPPPRHKAPKDLSTVDTEGSGPVTPEARQIADCCQKSCG